MSGPGGGGLVSGKIGEAAPSIWRGQRLRHQQQAAKFNQEQELGQLRRRRQQEALEERRQLIQHYSNYGMANQIDSNDIAEVIGQHDLEQLLDRNQNLLQLTPPRPSTTANALPEIANRPTQVPQVLQLQETERERRHRLRQMEIQIKSQQSKQQARSEYLKKLDQERKSQAQQNERINDHGTTVEPKYDRGNWGTPTPSDSGYSLAHHGSPTSFQPQYQSSANNHQFDQHQVFDQNPYQVLNAATNFPQTRSVNTTSVPLQQYSDDIDQYPERHQSPAPRRNRTTGRANLNRSDPQYDELFNSDKRIDSRAANTDNGDNNEEIRSLTRFDERSQADQSSTNNAHARDFKNQIAIEKIETINGHNDQGNRRSKETYDPITGRGDRHSGYLVGLNQPRLSENQNKREYARALEEQIEEQRKKKETVTRRDHGANEKNQQNNDWFSLGFEEKSETDRIQQQKEYGRELQRQMDEHANKGVERVKAAVRERSNSPISIGYGLGNRDLDRRSKLEYAKALQEQIREGEERRRQHRHLNRDPDMGHDHSPSSKFGQRVQTTRQKGQTIDHDTQMGHDHSPSSKFGQRIQTTRQKGQTIDHDTQKYARELQDQLNGRNHQQNPGDGFNPNGEGRQDHWRGESGQRELGEGEGGHTKGGLGQGQDINGDTEIMWSPILGRGERTDRLIELTDKRRYAEELEEQIQERRSSKNLSEENGNGAIGTSRATLGMGLAPESGSVQAAKRAKEEKYRAVLMQQMEERERQKRNEKVREMEEEANWAMKLAKENEELQNRLIAEKALEESMKKGVLEKQISPTRGDKGQKDYLNKEEGRTAQARARLNEQNDQRVENNNRVERGKGNDDPFKAEPVSNVDNGPSSAHLGQGAVMHGARAPGVHDNTEIISMLMNKTNEILARQMKLEDNLMDQLNSKFSNQNSRNDQPTSQPDPLLSKFPPITVNESMAASSEWVLAPSSPSSSSSWSPSPPQSPPLTPPHRLHPIRSSLPSLSQLVYPIDRSQSPLTPSTLPQLHSPLSPVQCSVPCPAIDFQLLTNPYVQAVSRSRLLIPDDEDNTGLTISCLDPHQKEVHDQHQTNSTDCPQDNPEFNPNWLDALPDVDTDIILNRNDERIQTLTRLDNTINDPSRCIEQYLDHMDQYDRRLNMESVDQEDDEDCDTASIYGNTRWLSSDPRYKTRRRR